MFAKGLSYFQTCSTHSSCYFKKKVKLMYTEYRDNSVVWNRLLICYYYYTTYNKCIRLACSIIHLSNY